MKDLTYELNVSVLQFNNVEMILAFGAVNVDTIIETVDPFSM